MEAVRLRASVRATALREEVVPPLAFRTAGMHSGIAAPADSPPTRTRIKFGGAPTRDEAQATADYAASDVGHAGGTRRSQTLGRISPALLRQTEQAKRQLGSTIAMWAMFASGRRANRGQHTRTPLTTISSLRNPTERNGCGCVSPEAREAETSTAGRMKAAAGRASAHVRPSTGRTAAVTQTLIREQICKAYSRPVRTTHPLPAPAPVVSHVFLWGFLPR